MFHGFRPPSETVFFGLFHRLTIFVPNVSPKNVQTIQIRNNRRKISQLPHFVGCNSCENHKKS